MTSSRPWQETRAHEGRYEPVGPWGAQAACKHSAPAMEMPGGRGSSNTPARRRHIAAARIICKGCPVRVECLDWAFTTPDPADGMIAGGLTPNERDRARQGRIA